MLHRKWQKKTNANIGFEKQLWDAACVLWGHIPAAEYRNEREAACGMKYSDEQRIKKIYENAVKLHEYIVSNRVKKEDLLKDVPLQWLVTTPLYNIGEHVYNLSSE